jgi:hypothetical protein
MLRVTAKKGKPNNQLEHNRTWVSMPIDDLLEFLKGIQNRSLGFPVKLFQMLPGQPGGFARNTEKVEPSSGVDVTLR